VRTKTTWLIVVLLGLSLGGLTIYFLAHKPLMHGNADPRAVLTIANYTRGLASETPAVIRRQLDTMPSAILPRDAASNGNRLLTWSLLFKRSMIKLGRLETATPQMYASANPRIHGRNLPYTAKPKAGRTNSASVLLSCWHRRSKRGTSERLR
jgi:hypothetical protein